MNRWVVGARLMGVGWYLGISIVLGLLGGRWLDGKLNSEPIFMIVGLILGLVIAFYGIYQMILPIINNKQDKEDN